MSIISSIGGILDFNNPLSLKVHETNNKITSGINFTVMAEYPGIKKGKHRFGGELDFSFGFIGESPLKSNLNLLIYTKHSQTAGSQISLAFNGFYKIVFDEKVKYFPLNLKLNAGMIILINTIDLYEKTNVGGFSIKGIGIDFNNDDRTSFSDWMLGFNIGSKVTLYPLYFGLDYIHPFSSQSRGFFRFYLGATFNFAYLF